MSKRAYIPGRGTITLSDAKYAELVARRKLREEQMAELGLEGSIHDLPELPPFDPYDDEETDGV